MLHIIAFIQCDICNGVLNQIAVAGDPRQDDSNDEDARICAPLHELRLSAEEHGWQATKDSTCHYCVACCRS
jgi:hypothetical protein